MQKPFIFIGIALAVLVLGAGAGYAFLRSTRVVAPATSTTTQASTTNLSAQTIKGPGYTIEQVSIQDQAPSLSHQPIFAATVPPDVQISLASQIAIEQAALKKDPASVEHWLQLGVLYHAGDDYDAARDVWLFLEKVLPTDTTAVGNLGRMYEFDLHDFPKAEQYFKEALARNPKSPDMYIELYELYRYSYKQNTTAAVDILKQGIVKVPGSAEEFQRLLNEIAQPQ